MNYVRCKENKEASDCEDYEYPMWLYASKTGGGFSWIDISDINLKIDSEPGSMMRMFLYAYENYEQPFWFYAGIDGDDWFSWIYRKLHSSETPRSWLSKEENKALGIED